MPIKHQQCKSFSLIFLLYYQTRENIDPSFILCSTKQKLELNQTNSKQSINRIITIYNYTNLSQLETLTPWPWKWETCQSDQWSDQREIEGVQFPLERQMHVHIADGSESIALDGGKGDEVHTFGAYSRNEAEKLFSVVALTEQNDNITRGENANVAVEHVKRGEERWANAEGDESLRSCGRQSQIFWYQRRKWFRWRRGGCEWRRWFWSESKFSEKNNYCLGIDIEGEKIDELMRREWGKLWAGNWVFFIATKNFVVI